MIDILNTDLCWCQNYPISTECQPGELIQWVVISAPPGVNFSDVQFLNENSAVTFVRLPKFEGPYVIDAIKQTPV